MRLLVVGLAVLASLLGGCSGPERIPRPEPMPTYPEAASRFNQRVERLDNVWSRANLTLRSPRESGGTSVNRSEGHLQVRLPSDTALTVEKFMETYLHFGSNDERYWWIDLRDSEAAHAFVGRHRDASPELVERLGLPVHPLELLDLFAITPLPETGSNAVEWDGERGEFLVTTRGLWGDRRVWLHPITYAPTRVVLTDGGGAVRAESDLDRYVSVPVRGDGRVPPKMASQYRILMPATGARLTLELYDPENRPIRDTAFDFEILVEVYGVSEVVELAPGELGAEAPE